MTATTSFVHKTLNGESMCRTGSEWAGNSRRQRPVLTSQVRTVSSKLPLTCAPSNYLMIGTARLGICCAVSNDPKGPTSMLPSGLNLQQKT